MPPFAQVDANGWSAAAYAAQGRHPETVEVLKLAGAEVAPELWEPMDCTECYWRGCVCGGIGRKLTSDDQAEEK